MPFGGQFSGGRFFRRLSSGPTRRQTMKRACILQGEFLFYGNSADAEVWKTTDVSTPVTLSVLVEMYEDCHGAARACCNRFSRPRVRLGYKSRNLRTLKLFRFTMGGHVLENQWRVLLGWPSLGS